MLGATYLFTSFGRRGSDIVQSSMKSRSVSSNSFYHIKEDLTAHRSITSAPVVILRLPANGQQLCRAQPFFSEFAKSRPLLPWIRGRRSYDARVSPLTWPGWYWCWCCVYDGDSESAPESQARRQPL
eukprot:GFYU01004950.1.p1 GENE.GFYU01004950.1~~GFYU01004950.1.p1  ORF type:complete len:127 (+),score=3.23 GFYU01004950.1:484-864(+)